MQLVRVSDVVALLQSLDGVYDAPPPEGDPVDLLSHGLQCAHELCKKYPEDVHLQVAGLVHDVGHAIDDDPDHARVAADAVRPVLGRRVSELVGLHVAAKRYLAATENYALSSASSASLVRQGSAMTAAEVTAFRALPNAADAVALRRADEAAKVVGRVVPGLDSWVSRLHLVAQGATA